MSWHIVAMVVARGVLVVRVTCWVMDLNEFGQDLSDDSPVVAASEPFEGFFRREYRSVLGLAFVLCGDRAVAEELTMEGFEAALRDWSRVSQLESPGGGFGKLCRTRRCRGFGGWQSKLERGSAFPPGIIRVV